MFDPENPTYATWSWFDENGWLPDNGHEIGLEDQETVLASEYDDLLEKYNLLLAAEPARVIPFKNGFWVFAKEYSFFTSRPENGQK